MMNNFFSMGRMFSLTTPFQSQSIPTNAEFVVTTEKETQSDTVQQAIDITESTAVDTTGTEQVAAVNRSLTVNTQAVMTAATSFGSSLEVAWEVMNDVINQANQQIDTAEGQLRNAIHNSKDEQRYGSLLTEEFNLTQDEINQILAPISSYAVFGVVDLSPAEYEAVMQESLDLLQEKLNSRSAVNNQVPSDRDNPNGDETTGYREQYNSLINARGKDPMGMSIIVAHKESNPDWFAHTFDFNAGPPPQGSTSNSGTANAISLEPSVNVLTDVNTRTNFFNGALDQMRDMIVSMSQNSPFGALNPADVMTQADRNRVIEASNQSFEEGLAIFEELVQEKNHAYDHMYTLNEATGQWERFRLGLDVNLPVVESTTSNTFNEILDSDAPPETYLQSVYQAGVDELEQQLIAMTGQGFDADEDLSWLSSGDAATLQSSMDVLIQKYNDVRDGDGNDLQFRFEHPTLNDPPPVEGTVDLSADMSAQEWVDALEGAIQNAISDPNFQLDTNFEQAILNAPTLAERNTALEEALNHYDEALDTGWIDDGNGGKISQLFDVEFSLPSGPEEVATVEPVAYSAASADEVISALDAAANKLLAPSGDQIDLTNDQPFPDNADNESWVLLKQELGNAYASGNVEAMNASLNTMTTFLSDRLSILSGNTVQLSATPITEGEPVVISGTNRPIAADPEVDDSTETLTAISDSVKEVMGPEYDSFDLNNLQEPFIQYQVDADAITQAYASGDVEAINASIQTLVDKLNTDLDSSLTDVTLDYSPVSQGEPTVITGATRPTAGDPEVDDATETLAAISDAVKEVLGPEYDSFDLNNLQEPFTQYQADADAIKAAYASGDAAAVNTSVQALVDKLNDELDSMGSDFTLTFDPTTQGELVVVTAEPALTGADAAATLDSLSVLVRELIGSETFDLNNLTEEHAALQPLVDNVVAAYEGLNPGDDFTAVNDTMSPLIAELNSIFDANGQDLNIQYTPISSDGLTDYNPVEGPQYSDPVFPDYTQEGNGIPELPGAPDGFTEAARVEGAIARIEEAEQRDDWEDRIETDFSLDQPSVISLSTLYNDGHPEQEEGSKHQQQFQWDEAHFARVLDADGNVVSELHAPDVSDNGPEIMLGHIQQQVDAAGIAVDLTADPATMDEPLKSLIGELNAAFDEPRKKRYDDIDAASQAIEDYLNQTFNPAQPIDYTVTEDVWMTATQEYPELVLPPGDYTLQIIHESPQGESPVGDGETFASRDVVAAVYTRPVNYAPGQFEGELTSPSINPGSLTPENITETLAPGSITPGSVTQTHVPGELSGSTLQDYPGSITYTGDMVTVGPGSISGEQVSTTIEPGEMTGDWNTTFLATTSPSSNYSSYSFMTPLILDMNGDGVNLTSVEDGVAFDLDGDGVKEQVAWSEAKGADTDGFLALDLDGNGTIDNGSELFGDQHGDANGFERLRQFDSNQDGKIDANDEAYSQMSVWQDINHDGVSQANEMVGLSQAGIQSVDLGYTPSNQVDPFGNAFPYDSTFTWADGTAGSVVDALLKTQPLSNVEVPPIIDEPEPVIPGPGGIDSNPIWKQRPPLGSPFGVMNLFQQYFMSMMMGLVSGNNTDSRSA